MNGEDSMTSNPNWLWLTDAGLQNKAVEMQGLTLVNCVLSTHVENDDYQTVMGIGYDLWNKGHLVKTGTYLYYLAQKVGYSKLNKALEAVIHRLKSVEKLDSKHVIEFIEYVVDLGFTVESRLQGTF